MLLKFTQEFFMQVVPEWYLPEALSGEGTLEEQICEYERQRAEKDGMYFANLKQGATSIEIVLDTPKKSELCNGLDVPHILGLHPDQCADCANALEADETNSVSQQGTSVPNSDDSQKGERLN
jgi:hypothetical protein